MFSTSAARTLLTYKQSCQWALFLWFGHFLGQTKFKLPVSLLKGWKHGVPLSFQLSMFCSSFSRLVTSCENDDICVDGWENSITTNLSFQFPPLKGDSWETPLLINVNGVNWCKNCLCQKGFWSGEMQKRSPISRSLTRANLKSDPMHIWESTNWICQAVLQAAKEEKNGGRADL